MSTTTTTSYDSIVIGSGPNELVCACYLAKAGQKVLVVPYSQKGSVASFQDIESGSKDAGAFRYPVASASHGFITAKIVKDLGLDARGFSADPLTWADPAVVTLGSGGSPFVLYRDQEKSRAEIAKHSKTDAGKWDAFCTRMARLAGFLETLYIEEPPRLMSEQAGDLFSLLAVGLRLRRLGKVDMIELLRTLPMSVQDLLDDTFDTEVLKATIGAGGITNILQGPRSAGTCFVMLHHMVGRPAGAFRTHAVVKNEQGHLMHALALAAKQLGVETRTSRCTGIITKKARAIGVLCGEEEIFARNVISGADPRTTFMKLTDPTELEPETMRAVQHVKLRGARAIVNLALAELPTFTGVAKEDLGGIISVGAQLDYLERAYDHAKHGRISSAPFLEATIPSIHDPSLAPPGKHVMSIAIQYAPYHLRDHNGQNTKWDAATKDALADKAIALLANHSPNLAKSIVGRSVFSPADLEKDFGLGEGHLHGGELTLDQILFMRPFGGFAHYRSPIEGLFMCGDSCHPGGALPGLAGANAAREIAKNIQS